MKQSMIVLAALAAGPALAQSSVTLYGTVDAALAFGRGSLADVTQLKSSGLGASNFGLRGTEDLGSGLSASFVLEAGINNDDGSGQGTSVNNQAGGGAGGGGFTFNRQSTLSLVGSWGELRLGRDYTPQFRSPAIFDPFSTNGVGTNQLLFPMVDFMPTYVRASNSIAYLYNTSGWGNGAGFYGTLQYALGENARNAANSRDGTALGVRVGYAAGPFNVALAASRTRYASGDAKQANLGASWNFGAGTLMAQVARDSLGPVDGRGWLVGGLIPAGAGTVRLSYARYGVDLPGDPSSRKLAIGYVHDLSKRTALYATFARVGNRGTAASTAGTLAGSIALNGAATGAGASSTGYEFGVRHSF